jgi:hypothetical protein
MRDQKGDDVPITESKFFHYVALAMGAVLLGLIGWIGLNVAHIPVIDEQIHDLRTMIEDVVNKQIADHEARIRILEAQNHK